MLRSRKITNGTGSALRPAVGIALVLVFMLLIGPRVGAQEIGGETTPSQSGSQVSESSDIDYEAITLRVGVWLDKDAEDVYRKGEDQAVGLQVNEDAYAVVYRIDSEGLVTILWPRSRMDDGFVFGGHEYSLPVSGARHLRVSTKEGEGFVEAIVSRYPFDLRDLEIDFHHESGDETFDFYVAGDPFLALNEVNYAITGLEDATDFVVTDNVSYYVHREVDHPRYLCNQCHIEDDVAYHPYRDTCTLEIKVDYGWYDGWYDRYGWYPVYANPVYVYFDPWLGRPWVNFWYDPWYRCPPVSRFWCGPVFGWYDSPYYWGNCHTYYDTGHRRYRPLGSPVQDDGVRRKTREYARVTNMLDGKAPSEDQRRAMRQRTTVIGDQATGGRTDVARTVVGRRAETRAVRSRPQIEAVNRVRTQPGLRIRDNSSSPSRSREGARHTAAGAGRRPAVTTYPERGSRAVSRDERAPVTIGRTGTQTTTTTSSRAVSPARSTSQGTRTWSQDSARGRTRDQRDSGTRLREKPRTSTTRSSRGREAVQPRRTNEQDTSTRRSSGSRVSESSSRESSSARQSSSSSQRVKQKSSSSSGSATKRSSGSNRSSGSSSRSKSSNQSSGKSSSRSSGRR